ncbi:saccharopine dehydrogenase family protein [Thalassobacillus pellis]|uniref:saccharopine dehydrogenase family protein n=1 Tax=Thalassobacillus pellis TaxID=748008 RepID=UPI001960CFC6|nr:saccharopine dehydrogenase NADP-binding domain-containing protein [Thalassobacillus pellis]MBM7554408.1 saccharopine dehydrogenase-like NADP-dependent oxidoreductase [Thalassobacillus pellis]
MKDHILVIGGYGHVGREISRKLGDAYPGKVIAAGRNIAKAEQFCRTTEGKVRPFQLNINDPVEPSILANIKLVIMCVDQKNTNFVRFCFSQGVHYMDLTANYGFLRQVERLHAQAEANEATAVLSVGLAPGLTNLLAELAKRQLDHVDTMDIAILLGMGDHHGKAAIEWTMDNLISDFYIMEKNKKVKVSSFSNRKKTYFGEELGHRMAYRFNFSDQHVLPYTLGIPSVSTRLCFDSRFVTLILSLVKRWGLARLCKPEFMKKSLVKLYSAITNKNEKVAIKIEAKGKKREDLRFVEYYLHGKENESWITARVATYLAKVMESSTFPSGVHHTEQLIKWEDVWQDMGDSLWLETRVDGKVVNLGQRLA